MAELWHEDLIELNVKHELIQTIDVYLHFTGEPATENHHVGEKFKGVTDAAPNAENYPTTELSKKMSADHFVLILPKQKDWRGAIGGFAPWELVAGNGLNVKFKTSRVYAASGTPVELVSSFLSEFNRCSAKMAANVFSMCVVARTAIVLG